MKDFSQCQKFNISSSRLKWAYCVAAFLLLLGGMAIYAFFRNFNLIIFQIFPRPPILEALHIPVSQDNVLMNMFLFSLPGGLWFLSGLLIIRAVWLANLKCRAIYACLFTLIAITMEILQIIPGVPGTFDFLDIAFYAFFAFVESVIFNRSIKRSILWKERETF